jgi:hypothetical protein
MNSPVKSSRLLWTPLFALSGLLLWPGPAPAQFVPEVSAQVSIRGVSDQQYGPTQAAVEMDRLFDVNDAGYSFGRSTTESRQGRLMVTNYVEVIGEEARSVDADSHAYFRDELIVDAPGLTGQAGAFTASVRLSGSLTAGANIDRENAAAEMLASFTLNSAQGSVTSSVSARRTNLGFSGQEATLLTVTVPFVFGQPIVVDMYMQTEADCKFGVDPGYACIAIVRYGNSASWTGIDAVTDSIGNPVSDYTVTSASGTDFTQNFEDFGIFGDSFESVDSGNGP